MLLKPLVSPYNKYLKAALSVCLGILFSGCQQEHLPPLSTGGHDYQPITLVADTTGYDALRIDSNLRNPWGLAISPTGKMWLGANHSGGTNVYDDKGIQLLPLVGIPFNGHKYGASPTGAVFNATTQFTVHGQPARFIFSTEDGIISAWVTGDTTIKVADRSTAGAIYKGIAIANDGTGNFIYATDFFNARIDVFDQNYNYVSNRPFTDPAIPAGYAPFNIRNINGKLYVTYARQKGPDKHDDEAGAGNGYVSIFSPDGSFVRRFASKGTLNSPWGIAHPPADFGQRSDKILVANFGDGSINVYDTLGQYKGQLDDHGNPIIINGLWDIVFSGTSNTQLFFTAGPARETHGMFGYIKMK